MNRPDKAGEQSMEEILASIRQIIADEPSDERPEPIEANPLVPSKPSSVAASPDARAPLLDRLNGVLRSGSLPPTSPFGSKRLSSFDQDLADMFDEDEGADTSLAVPKPAEIRVPEVSSPAGAKPSSGEDGTDKPMSNGAAAASPPVASPAFVPPLPFGSVDSTPATEAPPPPRNFGFPPLRKQGFYPPQGATPTLPPIPQAEPSPLETGSSAMPGESPEDALKRLSALGSVVPGEIASAPGAPASTAPLFGSPAFSALKAETPRAPEAAPSSSVFDAPTSFGGGFPKLGAEAPPSASLGAPVEAPSLGLKAEVADVVAEAVEEVLAEPAAAAAVPAAEPQPIEAEPVDPAPVPPAAAGRFTDRFASLGSGVTPPSPSVVEPAPRFGAPAPDVAAAQALDALAQGLAASAAASHFSGVAPAQSAIPLTPVVEPVTPIIEPHNALTPASSAPPAGPAPARTLEDAVADMLRPMLQQWVADNMPRIIEKALRNEVSNPVRPGQKPHGS
jgi:cell pole-organizing protein PopZ